MDSLQDRLEALEGLRSFILGDSPDWNQARQQAGDAHGWFTDEELNFALDQIAQNYLDADKLIAWTRSYALPVAQPRTLGLVMAGNIPLVGFHDFLCGWVSGHRMIIKASTRDAMLWQSINRFLEENYPRLNQNVQWTQGPMKADMFIATGSDNSARYFQQYFENFPHVIRKNRSSVALLDGDETLDELAALADDIFRYFGLGCRNVTQVFVPEGYAFDALLSSMESHRHRFDHHKYRNNYDYHLSVFLLNRLPILTNDLIILVENPVPYSPVSVLHYQYYSDRDQLLKTLKTDSRIQAIVGRGLVPFGQAQRPALGDYADGVDTMAFLTEQMG